MLSFFINNYLLNQIKANYPENTHQNKTRKSPHTQRGLVCCTFNCPLIGGGGGRQKVQRVAKHKVNNLGLKRLSGSVSVTAFGSLTGIETIAYENFIQKN